MGLANNNKLWQYIIQYMEGSSLPDYDLEALKEDMTNLFQNHPREMNEFLTNLVNRIGKVVVENNGGFDNVLASFKKGDLPYGASIEGLFVEMAETFKFDMSTAEQEVFKRVIPQVQAKIYSNKEENQWKTTTSQPQFRRALLTEQGLADLVSTIMNSLYEAKNQNEYLAMKGVLSEAFANGYIYPLKIDAIVDEATAKSAVVKVKEYGEKFKFKNPLFNYMGVKTHCNLENQVILMTPLAKAYIDVEVLALAFNIDKAKIQQRIIVVDDFGKDADGNALKDVEMMLIDEKLVQFYDTLVQTDTIYNPQGLYWNNLLNHWYIYGASPFAQAVAFVKDVNITAVSLTPATATVQKGMTQQMTADVTGDISNSVFYKTNSDNPNTGVTKTGMLYVAKDETKTSITVTATSILDNSKTKTATITVTA